jgi:hypothetical protein
MPHRRPPAIPAATNGCAPPVNHEVMSGTQRCERDEVASGRPVDHLGKGGYTMAKKAAKTAAKKPVAKAAPAAVKKTAKKAAKKK